MLESQNSYTAAGAHVERNDTAKWRLLTQAWIEKEKQGRTRKEKQKMLKRVL